MKRIRKLIVTVLIVVALWHFYGDTFKQDGVKGVYQHIHSDLNTVIENPSIHTFVNQVHFQIQRLVAWFDQTLEENVQSNDTPEKPQLNAPADQLFSIHNIEIGDDRSVVEKEIGTPKRTSLNEYDVKWVTYHENYHNFFMVAYTKKDKVAGLYTNQDLLTTTKGINFNSTRELVLNRLNEPLKSMKKGFVNYQIHNNQEYDTFLIDDNYVTIFYDKHEGDTVTAIQIINAELEVQKANYFSEPSKELREGFEYQLFDLTNATRVKHNLSILTWDNAVKLTARTHSNDMAENNYFSHTNLEGESPFDRMKEDDISFHTAGENLAYGQTSSIFAHQGLMNSLGHRENILNPNFERLGIGVAFNDDAQPLFTENFLTK